MVRDAHPGDVVLATGFMIGWTALVVGAPGPWHWAAAIGAVGVIAGCHELVARVHLRLRRPEPPRATLVRRRAV